MAHKEETYAYRRGKKFTLYKSSDTFVACFGLPRARFVQKEFDVAAEIPGHIQQVSVLEGGMLSVFQIQAAPSVRRSVKVRDRAMELLRGSPDSAFVSHGYFGDPERPDIVVGVADRIVVQFEHEETRDGIQSLCKKYGLEFIRRLHFMPQGYLLKVTARAKMNALKVANRIQEREPPRVRFAEVDFLRNFTSRRSVPNIGLDQYLKRQWHLHNTGQSKGKPGADVQAFKAWRISRGSQDVLVAVVDQGVDVQHEEFISKVVRSWNFDSGNPDTTPQSWRESHGHCCAGVAVAAGNNHVGGSGIAPNCRLIAIRISLDSFQWSTQAAEALVWAADNGAWVISNSYGPQDKGWVSYRISAAEAAAFDYCTDRGRKGKGCIVVVAAGNGNQNVMIDEWTSHERNIVVAASTHQDKKADYSQWGNRVSVCAPSSGGQPHAGILTTELRSHQEAGLRPGYTNDFGGTSSACPLVAGIAALILSVNPALTWRGVKKILEETAQRIDSHARYIYLDRNRRHQTISAAYRNGHSLVYGYGRVNAAKALERAKQLPGSVV